MFNYSKDGITIASIIDTRKKNTKECYPIKIRITYKRVRKYYSTGKDLSQSDWDKLPQTKVRKLKDVRESIENSFSLVKKNVESLADYGEFSFDVLNQRLGRGTSDSVNTAFEAKILQLEKEERVGTSLLNKDTLRLISLFSGNNISFESVTINWLKRFENFLLKDKNHTTAGMHFRNIRAIMNEAKKSGNIKETQYPFGKGKFEIQTGESRKKALNIDQLKQIVKYDDGKTTTRMYRDIWLFIYLCNGINVADLVKLTYSNIIDDEICFIRQKTEKTTKSRREIQVTLTPQMKTIIKKWGNKNQSSSSYIFLCLEGTEDAMKRKEKTKSFTKRINKRMNVIGATLGFGGITTYTARHSFATVLKRSGANISYISESLGHHDLQTTESYLASFEKEERQKNAEYLLNPFKM